MTLKIKDKEIDRFWHWFSENCQSFGSKFENSVLLTELDTWISNLGDFSWEVGPGKIKENALVISPNGDFTMLEYTKKIVARAIPCNDWEYYYAKPPKKWDMKFDYETGNGQNINIDASSWEYVLLRYDDRKFDIKIKPDIFSQIGYEDKLVIAEILLDGILGEEKRMRLINFVDVVREFEAGDKRGINDINTLADHISSLK